MKLQRRIRDSYKRPLAVVFLTVVTIGTLAISTQFTKALPGSVGNALEANAAVPINISPNPYGFLLFNANNGNWWPGSWFDGLTNGRSSNIGFKHLLKNEQSSYINTLRLLAYYPTQAAAESATFRIHRERCGFNASNGGLSGSDRHFLRFYINGTLRYEGAATGNQSSATCGSFGGVYSASGAGVPVYDAGTGYYKVELLFNLDGIQLSSSTQGQQVRFQVKAEDGSAVFGMEKNTGSAEFGIAEEFGNENYSIAAGVPFGRSCTESSGATANANVRIYDADTPLFGTINAYILWRDAANPNWRKLARTDYNQTAMNNRSNGTTFTWNGGNQRWEITTTGASNTTSTIVISQFDRDKDYMLIFENQYQPPNRSPTGNVLSLSVPGDTINASFSCDYNLVPTIVEPTVYDTFLGDANFPVQGRIANLSPGIDNDDHQWQLSQIITTTRPANLGAAINGQSPCSWQPTGCSVFSGNAGVQAGGFQAPFTRSGNYSQNNVPVGTWICFMMSVRGPTPGSNQWSHSALHCRVAGLQPRVEVWGHDARVLGTTDTSITDQINGASHEYFGSWGQYGIFSSGVNNNTSSGLGINRGVANANQNAWSSLTFGNVDGAGLQFDEFGYYNNLVDNTPVYDPPYTPNPPGNNFTPNNGQFRDYGPGTRAIYDMRGGTARISANIRYTGQYNWVEDIPTVVIMADDIVIDDNVRQIDAVLIANRITTCRSIGFAAFDTPNLLRANSCSNALQFNSPVYVHQLYLFRTGGNNTNAAETFNMRGDVFMAAFGARVDTPVATTDVITELPPRF